MKYYVLKSIVAFWQQYEYLSHIKRVDDTVLKLTFNRDAIYYIDLTKGNSTIYQKDEGIALKSYNAPFDQMLHKYFTQSHIQSITIPENDKIIRIDASSSSSYKSQRAILQLEFTGKNTNAILLNEQESVIEALRHIGPDTSFRIVQPNKKLLPIPPREFRELESSIKDVPAYLRQVYLEKVEKTLQNHKKQALDSLDKKKIKLVELFENLEDEEKLQKKSAELKNRADLLLANLSTLPAYQKKVELQDFESNPISIPIPSQARDYKEAAKIYYDQSRRARQKAENMHIERENLESKITFMERLKQIVETAKSIDEINLYLPKKRNRIKKEKERSENFETFFIEGYKISLGKSEKENKLLLKYAKADDTWLHLRDMRSAHVIIHSGKHKISQKVLENAAKICVNFSDTGKGSYEVDYTKRKHVRIQDGANVLYTHYQTLSVSKE